MFVISISSSSFIDGLTVQMMDFASIFMSLVTVVVPRCQLAI